jgi:hypothetical protein
MSYQLGKYLSQLQTVSNLKIRNALQDDIRLKVKYYYWRAFVKVALRLQVTYESRGNWKTLTSDILLPAHEDDSP